jgi:hypothetical protein
MSFDEKFRRAFELLQPEIGKMLERQRARIAGYDDVKWDEASNETAYFRGGAALWRPIAEPLARFTPDLGLFRWAWAGRGTGHGVKSRVDLAYREAHEMNIAEVQTDQVYCDSEKEAEAIAALGAQLARADGILKVSDGMRVVFVALWDPSTHLPGGFDTPARKPRPSQAPPPVRDDALDLTPYDRPIATGPSFRPAVVGSARPSQAPPPGPATRRSAVAPGPGRPHTPVAPIPVVADDPWDVPPMPAPAPPREARESREPPRESREPARASAPSPALPVREPSPAIFRPVAQLVLGALSMAMPGGFREAMFLMSLDVQDGKGRFYVHLVASTLTGELVAPEPSRELLEATARMVTDDAREGNGRWRKLVAKLSATDQGVAVDLEVKK